jgi:ATP-dependent Zn protease
LENLRKPRKDDLQAITAVHESGHAIISTLLLKTIPELVFSVTADVESGGFIYSKINSEFISKKDIINFLALNLGGYAAEKIIFGKEYLTSGSGSDLKKATNFICHMLRNSGMSSVPANFSVQDFRATEYIFDASGELNAEAKKYIQEALELAELTLIKEKKLLIKMSLHLADNRSLKKEQLTELMREHLIHYNLELILKESAEGFYRDHLFKLAKQEEHQNAGSHLIDQQLKSMNLILNQENKNI